jgi:ribonuclease HI
MSLFPEPTSDFVYAHCDGGSRGNPGPSGYGAVVTDAQGCSLAELSEFLGVRTNNYAEYSGLLAVLAWALEKGHERVKVVSDSELMVKQIQGKYKVNSPDLKPLWQEARNRIAKLERFEISHALRHKNKAADALANQAMDRGMRRTIPREADPVDPPARPGIRPVAAPIQANVKPAPARQHLEPGGLESRPNFPAMLRGVVKNGAVQILGGHAVPDGTFVKIIRE